MWVSNQWLRSIQKNFYTYNNIINRQLNGQLLNLTGIWDSNFGKIVLKQEGSKITGYYYRYDGFIRGIINDQNIFNGVWKSYPAVPQPEDFGTTELIFTRTSFDGKWGYGDQPQYYSWFGNKISSSFIGENCYRYRIQHDSSELPEVVVNDESISYGEKTSYFYPEECSDFAKFQLLIAGNIISEKIPVEPGYSYTFAIQGTLPNITIDIIVDNPFPNL